MVVDIYNLSIKVEYGLSDLLGSRLSWIKIKLLRHLLDWNFLCIVALLNFEILSRFARSVWIETVTAIGKVVWPILVLLNDLVLLLSNELLSQNETIIVSMMIVVKFLVLTVDLDELFPVEVLSLLIRSRWSLRSVVFNQFELIWESSSEYQLIFPSSIVGSDLFGDKTLVIPVDCHTFDQTINLTLKLAVHSLAL